jgi:hypothetical protein
MAAWAWRAIPEFGDVLVLVYRCKRADVEEVHGDDERSVIVEGRDGL